VTLAAHRGKEHERCGSGTSTGSGGASTES
jgi:hypothetical protein